MFRSDDFPEASAYIGLRQNALMSKRGAGGANFPAIIQFLRGQ
jgi:hypothetical protein